MLMLAQPPCQQSINSLTWRGITQDTPKRDKTVSHSSLAQRQWIKRWSTDSPAALHKQHLLTSTIFLFHRLSAVGVYPALLSKWRKLHEGGLWASRCLSMETSLREGSNNDKRTAQKNPFSPFGSNKIYQPHFHPDEQSKSEIHKWSQWFQFPILDIPWKA